MVTQKEFRDSFDDFIDECEVLRDGYKIEGTFLIFTDKNS